MPETIHLDIKCMGCGYNLRTLRSDSVCPECGRKVEWSLEGRRMVFAPTKGQRFCLRWGPLAINVSFLIFMLIGQFRPRQPLPYDELYWFGFPALLFTVGVWALTSPVAREDGPEIGFLCRWAARLLSVAPVLAALFWQIGFAWVPWDQGVTWMYWADHWPPLGLFCVSALCWYMARIAHGLCARGTQVLALIGCFGSISAGLLQLGNHPFRSQFSFPNHPLSNSMAGCFFGFISIGAFVVPLLMMVWSDQITAIATDHGRGARDTGKSPGGAS